MFSLHHVKMKVKKKKWPKKVGECESLQNLFFCAVVYSNVYSSIHHFYYCFARSFTLWGKNILNEIRWRLSLYFTINSCFTYYLDWIWAKRFSFSFERTSIMVRQNAFSKVAFSHVKIFANDRGRSKYIFFKKDAPLSSFHEVCKEKFVLSYSFPNYRSLVKGKKTSIFCAKSMKQETLRQKYPLGLGE